MKLSQLEAGMTVWSLFRTKMGNTTIKTVTLHSVVIQEVYDNHVIASWNRNAPRRFGETAISSWKKISRYSSATVPEVPVWRRGKKNPEYWNQNSARPSYRFGPFRSQRIPVMAVSPPLNCRETKQLIASHLPAVISLFNPVFSSP